MADNAPIISKDLAEDLVSLRALITGAQAVAVKVSQLPNPPVEAQMLASLCEQVWWNFESSYSHDLRHLIG